MCQKATMKKRPAANPIRCSAPTTINFGNNPFSAWRQQAPEKRKCFPGALFYREMTFACLFHGSIFLRNFEPNPELVNKTIKHACHKTKPQWITAVITAMTALVRTRRDHAHLYRTTRPAGQWCEPFIRHILFFVPCRVVGKEVNIPLLTLVETRKGKLYNTFWWNKALCLSETFFTLFALRNQCHWKMSSENCPAWKPKNVRRVDCQRLRTL